MKLKKYRTQIKLTQQQVADALGISRQYVSDIERGKYEPGIKLGKKICAWSKNKITYLDMWR